MWECGLQGMHSGPQCIGQKWAVGNEGPIEGQKPSILSSNQPRAYLFPQIQSWISESLENATIFESQTLKVSRRLKFPISNIFVCSKFKMLHSNRRLSRLLERAQV